MNKDRQKSSDPAVPKGADARSEALFKTNAPSGQSPDKTGRERLKRTAPDGLADHQRNPLAPPVTITANS